jgi:DNA-binding MarR family transcriptional regulator
MPVLSWRLWLDLQQAANHARSALEEEAASLQLTPAAMNVLVNVAYEPGLTAKALAGVSGIKDSTLTGVIDKLEKAGLLARDRGHDDDRRTVSLQLTPEGRERAAQARAAMSRYRTWLVASSIPPEDIKAFGRVLSAIARNATTKASSA